MDARVTTIEATADESPVVVVGAGPAGVRAVQEIVRWRPDATVVWYGDEPWQPYNRI